MRLPPYHSKATSFWYVNVNIGSRFVTCWPNCHWHLQAIGDLQICPHDPKHPEPPMIVFDRQNTDSVEAKNSVKLNATAVSLSRNLDLILSWFELKCWNIHFLLWLLLRQWLVSHHVNRFVFKPCLVFVYFVLFKMPWQKWYEIWL